MGFKDSYLTRENKMADENVNETTEEVNETPSVEELLNEVAKWKSFSRKHEEEAKALKSRVSEVETQEELIKAAQEEAKRASSELTRYKVATRNAIPETALKFLTGSTEEELEKSAAELKALLSGATKHDEEEKKEEKPAPKTLRTAGGGVASTAKPKKLTLAQQLAEELKNQV